MKEEVKELFKNIKSNVKKYKLALMYRIIGVNREDIINSINKEIVDKIMPQIEKLKYNEQKDLLTLIYSESSPYNCVYKRLENYINELTTTLYGSRLLELDPDEIYNKIDLKVSYYQENSFGIFTRYNDGKKEYVIYKVDERNSILYYDSYDNFPECLKKAKWLQERQMDYNKEVERISNELREKQAKLIRK